MTEREKLIELIIEAKRTDPEEGSFTEYLTDYLLQNGVIVPPCKIKQKVWGIFVGNEVREFTVWQIKNTFFDELYVYLSDHQYDNFFVDAEDFGKTVFLSREEAEKALKEREHYE